MKISFSILSFRLRENCVSLAYLFYESLFKICLLDSYETICVSRNTSPLTSDAEWVGVRFKYSNIEFSVPFVSV